MRPTNKRPTILKLTCRVLFLCCHTEAHQPGSEPHQQTADYSYVDMPSGRYEPVNFGREPRLAIGRAQIEREIFVDNLLVRVRWIIAMIAVERPCAMGV